jgi:hypothetical protein
MLPASSATAKKWKAQQARKAKRDEAKLRLKTVPFSKR